MKTITVSARAKALNDLLKQARRGTIILESADGERFALTSVGNWEGFEVGGSKDFAHEVERTGKNKRLMKALASRAKQKKSPGVPLAQVRQQLGLE